MQVLGGRNIRISENTIVGGTNSALQITQGQGLVNGLAFSSNWVDGGGCSVNVAATPLTTMSGISVGYIASAIPAPSRTAPSS